MSIPNMSIPIKSTPIISTPIMYKPIIKPLDQWSLKELKELCKITDGVSKFSILKKQDILKKIIDEKIYIKYVEKLEHQKHKFIDNQDEIDREIKIINKYNQFKNGFKIIAKNDIVKNH